MAESYGAQDRYSPEALLFRRIAELEAALEKSNFERDKSRNMVNDLCD